MGTYFMDQNEIFKILHMKTWVYISCMKIEFSVFHIKSFLYTKCTNEITKLM